MAWALRLLAAFGVTFCLTASLARASDSAIGDFETDILQICGRARGIESRVVGSTGYRRTEDYLQKQFDEILADNPDVVEAPPHQYQVMAPVTRLATAKVIKGGASFPIYPFWPAQVRVDSTPIGGIRGRLVYVGQGRVEEIRPADLKGQIAVVDAAGGELWRQAFYFGASAVLILGTPSTNNYDLRSHDLDIPVSFPRFYVPPGEFSDAIKAGKIVGDVVLDVDVRWQRTTAVNYYVLVKPKRGSPSRAFGRNPAAMMISVPYESSGLVPDLAQGAGQAANTAAGLYLLRQAAANPLDRPVLFFFGGCDSIQFRATREMLMAFSDVPAIWNRSLNDKQTGINPAIQCVKSQIDRLGQVVNDPSELDPVKDRDLLERVTRLIETDISEVQDRLYRLRAEQSRSSDDAVKAEIGSLEKKQRQLSELRFVLQRRPESLREPDPNGADQFSTAKGYVERELVCLKGVGRPGAENYVDGLLEQQEERKKEIETRIRLYHWLSGELGLPLDPPEGADNTRLIDLLVAIDLSDQGVRVGPVTDGQFEKKKESRVVQNYNLSLVQNYKIWFNSLYTSAVQDDNAAVEWFKPLRGVLDLVGPISNMRSTASWLCASMPVGSEMASSWGVPGLSMVTLDDLRLTRDTPNDTLKIGESGKIVSPDVGVIEPQLEALKQVLWHAWNDPAFSSTARFSPQRNSFTGQVVSACDNRPTPDLPRPGFLVTYYYTEEKPEIITPTRLPWTMGIRRGEVHECDAEGNYYFEGLSKLEPLTDLAVEAYRIRPEDRGKISATTEVGQQALEISPYVDLKKDITPVRSVVFDCSEFSLEGLYDPRFLQDLGEVMFLDARRNDVPLEYNGIIGQQMLAGFVEPGSVDCLLFRYGRVGNRLILLNMPKVQRDRSSAPSIDLGAGFTSEQLSNLGPLSLVTTNDFYQLNEYRLQKYRAAAVSNGFIDDLHAKALDALLRAREAYSGGSAGGNAATRPTAASLMRNANAAWADEARVYAAATDMAADVIHGAIFLLLLCVPFSICMERLIVSTPNIYRQIGYTFLIFLLMTGVLFSFHPAFKISTSPLIIILAFAIVFMSVMVIGVVYGKFDTELKKIRSGRGSAQSVTFARASVLKSAVMLGIANMRRRRFRTALTSIAIVLITFAVLCFTSSSTVLDTTSLATGVMPKAPSLMIRQRGFRPIPTVALENLRAALPGRQLVERWWNINPNDSKECIHVVAPANHTNGQPAVFSAAAVLGLSPGESGLSNIADVIGRAKYSRLENGEARIVFMSLDIASELGVSEGDTVKIGGIPLQVAGLFDARRFDSEMTNLDGEMISPLDYSEVRLDASTDIAGKAAKDDEVEALNLDGGASAAELGNAYQHLSSTQYVIVPAAISRLLPNASLRNVGLRLDDYSEVKPVSEDLARRFAVAIFAGFQDGVKMISANNSLPRLSGGSVVVPVAIGGLIIFNTMMGSIAERRREIYVYTSLGLAPLHVGVLFVAEALTYGLIGVVFGYVIGQGVGTALDRFHLLGRVTLNYSGTSAMFTMGLILFIVLLSSLAPARLASKIAAPSIDRSWSVPLPQGEEIAADLPFTIDKTAADGALAYLAEYFDMHREGSIGAFSSDKIEGFAGQDNSGRAARGLRCMIWLTPFDLGVRQQLTLMIHPGKFEDIYEVQVILRRLSGDNGSWYRMNRPFLTGIRKQFLQWRSLSPERMMEYVEASGRLFMAS
jgi:ABC-type antimicrobial peptide transport system permease subunit